MGVVNWKPSRNKLSPGRGLNVLFGFSIEYACRDTFISRRFRDRLPASDQTVLCPGPDSPSPFIPLFRLTLVHWFLLSLYQKIFSLALDVSLSSRGFFKRQRKPFLFLLLFPKYCFYKWGTRGMRWRRKSCVHTLIEKLSTIGPHITRSCAHWVLTVNDTGLNIPVGY